MKIDDGLIIEEDGFYVFYGFSTVRYKSDIPVTDIFLEVV